VTGFFIVDLFPLVFTCSAGCQLLDALGVYRTGQCPLRYPLSLFARCWRIGGLVCLFSLTQFSHILSPDFLRFFIALLPLFGCPAAGPRFFSTFCPFPCHSCNQCDSRFAGATGLPLPPDFHFALFFPPPPDLTLLLTLPLAVQPGFSGALVHDLFVGPHRPNVFSLAFPPLL